MSGLILKLRPGERLLVNGAVIENGEHRARLRFLSANAKILRLKDALHPDEIDTPVKRACFLTQVILSGDCDGDASVSHAEHQIRMLEDVFVGTLAQAEVTSAIDALEAGSFYTCLKHLRKLLPIETALLEHIQP